MVATDPGIYIDTVSKTYHWRPVVNGKRTSKAFGTTQIGQARLLYAEILDKQRRVDQGLVPKQEEKTRLLITEALLDYEKSGYSSFIRDAFKKPGDKHIVTEKLSVVHLKEGFAKTYADELDRAKLVEYKTWRVKDCKKISHVEEDQQGARAVDLDINTLSKSLEWAVHGTKKLMVNPIKPCPVRFYDKGRARHAKDACPGSSEEFWKVGECLFEKPKSGPSGEVLGWVWMFLGTTGMRTEEGVELKRDASGIAESGFIQKAQRLIYSVPGKKKGKTKAYYLRDEALIVMEAMERWAERVRPRSPFYFPAQGRGRGHIGLQSLNHRLDELFESGKIETKLIGHGARAFFVMVLRTLGIPDQQIALIINQSGGTKTLEESYGANPFGAHQGKKVKPMLFLPKDKKKYPWAKMFKKLGLKV